MNEPKKKAQPAELTLGDDLLAALDENDRLRREIVETARAKKAQPAELTLLEDLSVIRGEINRRLRKIVKAVLANTDKLLAAHRRDKLHAARRAAELLAPIAAARELGISYTSLNLWRRYGCPAHYEQRGLKVVARYNLEEVRAWRDKRAAALNATRKELAK